MDEQKDEDIIEVKTPDEQSGISAEGHLRIFDPETNEDIVNGRDL